MGEISKVCLKFESAGKGPNNVNDNSHEMAVEQFLSDINLSRLEILGNLTAFYLDVLGDEK